MNFKDTQYYIAKAKYYVAVALSAIAFDALVLCVLFA